MSAVSDSSSHVQITSAMEPGASDKLARMWAEPSEVFLVTWSPIHPSLCPASCPGSLSSPAPLLPHPPFLWVSILPVSPWPPLSIRAETDVPGISHQPGHAVSSCPRPREESRQLALGASRPCPALCAAAWQGGRPQACPGRASGWNLN